MPTPVLQAQLRHLQLEAETGGYEAAAAADDRIEAIYELIARLLNADRAEIALVENATVAWDMAFYSVGFAPGDRILTARSRVREQLHRLPAGRTTQRRGRRRRAER